MTDQLISFETSKLFKEKGFQIPESSYAYFNGKIQRCGGQVYHLNQRCEAPTQSLLQKWLRDVHNIHVFIGRRPNIKKWDSHAYSLSLSGKEYVKERTMEKFRQQPLFDTYEEALESGLQEALKLI